MSNVFKTQSLLTITLETSYPYLNTATVKQIKYTKPDGTVGSFTATINGTTLNYNVQNGDIDQAGVWNFQAYVEIGGLKGFGDVADHKFNNPL